MEKQRETAQPSKPRQQPGGGRKPTAFENIPEEASEEDAKTVTAQEPQKAGKASATKKAIAKVARRFSRDKDEPAEDLELPTSQLSVGSKPERSNLRPQTASDEKNKNLKRSEGSPVTFFPVVEVTNLYQSENRRKSSTYNPFQSFERRVSISNPKADTKRPMGAGEMPRLSTVSTKSVTPYDTTRRSSSTLRIMDKNAASVANLTKRDIAICFFPEEPDWGDDEDFDYDNIIRPFPDEKGPGGRTFQRERWENRLVYLVALITYSISFSNIYHFPSLVYEYGGIPFLIPYTIFTIIIGYPLHFLESSLGQYSQSGPVKVWDCAPIGRGIGLAMFFLCLVVAYYYNMYAAYSVVYFSRCFNKVLPWQDCDEPVDAFSNYSCVPRMCAHSDLKSYTPAEHYFFDHVLQVRYAAEILGDGLGPMVWTEFLGFLFAWIVIYVSIIQGVRSIGKVSFFLVILPYFVLLMLLMAGFMLEGSSRGLNILFGTNFQNLLNVQVWRTAAEQVFFELGICQGTPLAYGSYCHHRNPTHIDSAIICFINYCTSILCALVIFNILGALSVEAGMPVVDVTNRGPGIVFITYPEALCRVPGSHFWCIAFFLMLFSVAVGTQIPIMQTVMTVLYDEFVESLPYRWLINLVVCGSLFMIGVVLCTSNGFYIVHLLDRMTGKMPRLPIAVCMVATLVLVYGISKYCEDMHFMLDYYPSVYVRLSFLIIPILLFALTVASWVLMEPLKIANKRYVIDAILVGWFSVWFILAWILVGAIYWIAYCYHSGQLKGVFRSLNSWGPRVFEARVARTEFSSDNVSNFTKPWNKKSLPVEEE